MVLPPVFLQNKKAFPPPFRENMEMPEKRESLSAISLRSRCFVMATPPYIPVGGGVIRQQAGLLA
jgi:hypothetical protein